MKSKVYVQNEDEGNEINKRIYLNFNFSKIKPKIDKSMKSFTHSFVHKFFKSHHFFVVIA